MNKHKLCPACGEMNDDNWPLKIDGKIALGGCQMCWEKYCSEEWWKMCAATGQTIDEITAATGREGK